jgi:adenylate kinase
VPLDVVILGPPGAGKGTQAALIARDAQVPKIATGDMLREAMAAETEVGLRVKPIYDAGDLVPDDLMIELIRERLSQPDTASGFVLDGFPRTIAQAEALDEMLTELDREISVVLQFQVSDECALERLRGRAEHEHRTDDGPEVVLHRIAEYHEKTEPLVEYYRSKGILVGIHADRLIEDVYAEVQDVLEAATAR